MYLRNIAIHADKEIVERYKGGFVQRFHRDTCCITEHYQDLIYRKVKTDRVAKVGLIFSDCVDTPPTTLALGACRWPFVFREYQDCDNTNRKRLILDTLQESLLWIAEKVGWQTGPFEDAHEEAHRREMKYQGFSKKSWCSPCGTYRARIHFDFDIDGVKLEAILYKNRSKTCLARRDLGLGLPEMGCLNDYLKNAEWTSPFTFRVSSASFLRERWTADFSDFIRKTSAETE